MGQNRPPKSGCEQAVSSPPSQPRGRLLLLVSITHISMFHTRARIITTKWFGDSLRQRLRSTDT